MTTDMTTSPTHSDSPHLDDQELLRLVDQDGTPEWRTRRMDHLRECPRCARELESLSADADLLRLRLDQADFEDAAVERPAPVGSTPPRHSPLARLRPRSQPVTRASQRQWLRAAAVILLVAAPVAAFPGIRAWITDAAAGPGQQPLAVPTTAGPDGETTDPAVLRFVPLPGSFAIHVDLPQEEGVLEVRQGSNQREAVVRLPRHQAPDAPGPVVSEGALRIRNLAPDRGSYLVEVPAGVTEVVVTVAGVTVAELSSRQLRSGVALPLRSP
jgi:hypothetical protein